MKCPKCNHIVKDTAKFCENCGAKIEVDNSTIECPSCHAQIPKDSKFCPDCGHKVNKWLSEFEEVCAELKILEKKVQTASGKDKIALIQKIDYLKMQRGILGHFLLFS